MRKLDVLPQTAGSEKDEDQLLAELISSLAPGEKEQLIDLMGSGDEVNQALVMAVIRSRLGYKLS